MLITGLVEGQSVGVWGMLSEEDTLVLPENQLYMQTSSGSPLVIRDFKGFDWVMVRVRKAQYLPYEIVVSVKQPCLGVLSTIDPMFRLPLPWWKRWLCYHEWTEWSDAETYQWTGILNTLCQADFSWRSCPKCGKVGQRISKSVRRVDG